MTTLRRFASEQQARIENSPELPAEGEYAAEKDAQHDAPAEPSADEALGGLLAQPAARENATYPTDDGRDSGVAAPLPKGRISQLKQSAPPPQRAVTDTVVLLKSLTPVLRAALVFPGPEAPAAEFGAAVGHLSSAVAELTAVMARESDPLELDSRWARKSLQEVASDLVAHYWVSSIIAQGGMSLQQLPPLPVDRLSSGVREVLRLPVSASGLGAKESLNISIDGSIRLSFLKAFAPLAVEIERYGEIVNRRLEQRLVDVDALELAIGQSLVDQACTAQVALMGEADISDDERRMTLQACLAHAGALYLAVWEPTRGDALGTLADAPSAEAGSAALKGADFEYGFPLATYKERAGRAMERLTGTTLAALALRATAAHPDQREGE